MNWLLKKGHSIEELGLIPVFIDSEDKRHVKEQFNERYSHGGGWNPFKGFTLTDNNELVYPGDPGYEPIAKYHHLITDELVLVYPHAWVAIVQNDRSFEVSRMD